MNEPLRIEPDAFYTDNALFLAGLSDSALARARKAGELKYTRRGGRIMYRGSWIIEWLEGETAAAGGGVLV